MNRYKKFVERRKSEGKQRKSMWCTDLEWKVLSYFRDRIELVDVNPLDEIAMNSMMINIRRGIDIPYGCIVRFVGFESYRGDIYIPFLYKGMGGRGRCHDFKLVQLK
jgi:hypothetical protein